MSKAKLTYSKMTVLFLWILCTSSCSVSKGLEKGEYLYKETQITIKDESKIMGDPHLKKNLKLLPKIGTSFGFLNAKLGLYNIFKESKDTGFKHWVKYKLGEKPAIYNENQIGITEAKLKYFLDGKGYFNSKVKCTSEKKDTIANVYCDIDLGTRYTIDSVAYPTDTLFEQLTFSNLLKYINWNNKGYYDRDKLYYYRNYIAQAANDQGYVNMGIEHVYYYVDTTIGNHKANLYLEILQPSDSTYHKRYLLDEINIYPNYSLEDVEKTDAKKQKISKGINIHERNYYISHALLDRLILEKPKGWYNKKLESRSLNRLLDLGLFKFVNIKNEANQNDSIPRIKQSIFLTPTLMQSVSGELEVNNRSGNFFGIGASVSYLHRNIFNHAENLKISLAGQLENQFGDELAIINSSDFNISAELSFPRIIIPFINIRESLNYIPRTIVNSNFSFQRRAQFYTIESWQAKYGIRWRETEKKSHEFFPINITQVGVSDKSDAFQEILDDDIRLRRSFENVLIAGLQYKYTYTDQSGNADRRFRYLEFEIETSGNIFSLFGSGKDVNSKKILGIPFAQFSKFTLDYRQYFPSGNSVVATHFVLGLGLAYGNSDELPYIEQYLTGGSNNIRAFPLRGLGPGSFVQDPLTEEDPTISQFIDQTGDMKIEMNVEYRFPLISYLKGAFFVDAGNIWLIDNEVLPEGNFRFTDFYENIAIGAGIGLRLDFDFFLIRLDTAFPLRAPVFQQGFQWKVREIDFFSGDWRRENIQLNLGIGYPF
jgi:outer membrane translocation and assembly module TamA